MSCSAIPLTVSDARISEIFHVWNDNDRTHPDHTAVLAAERRFITPIYAHEDYTGHTPTVLRVPRPANDVDMVFLMAAANYVLSRAARPVLIEYDTPPASSTRARRIASVSLGHAWRVAKRAITL